MNYLHEKVMIIQSPFCTKKDLNILTDAKLTSSTLNRLYRQARTRFINQLAAEGKVCINQNLIPTKVMMEELETYGVTEEKIKEDYKYFMSIGGEQNGQ